MACARHLLLSASPITEEAKAESIVQSSSHLVNRTKSAYQAIGDLDD